MFSMLEPGSIPGWGTKILKVAKCGKKEEKETLL